MPTTRAEVVVGAADVGRTAAVEIEEKTEENEEEKNGAVVVEDCAPALVDARLLLVLIAVPGATNACGCKRKPQKN